MNRIILTAAAGLTIVSMGVTRHTGLEGRLATLEEGAARPRTQSVAASEVNELRERLNGLLLSLIHISEPTDRQKSRMPSSA